MITNFVEEDLTAGESNVEKKISVGEETFVLRIRHCCKLGVFIVYGSFLSEFLFYSNLRHEFNAQEDEEGSKVHRSC